MKGPSPQPHRPKIQVQQQLLLPIHYQFQSTLRCFQGWKPRANHEGALTHHHVFARLTSSLLALIQQRFAHDLPHVLLQLNRSTWLLNFPAQTLSFHIVNPDLARLNQHLQFRVHEMSTHALLDQHELEPHHVP